MLGEEGAVADFPSLAAGGRRPLVNLSGSVVCGRSVNQIQFAGQELRIEETPWEEKSPRGVRTRRWEARLGNPVTRFTENRASPGLAWPRKRIKTAAEKPTSLHPLRSGNGPNSPEVWLNHSE